MALKLEEIAQNEIFLKMYSKKSCKLCRGKGYFYLDNGKGSVQQKCVCKCVIRGVKRG